MAKAYTPLSLLDCLEFRKLISSLDPRIVPISQSLLSRKLIPIKYETLYSDVMKDLNNCMYVVLSFNLLMSVKK